jgi:hypothetical protein
MAEPWIFSSQDQTFTFSNGHVTFVADTTIVPSPPQPPEVTVDAVSLENHHGTHELGVHDLVVPPPVVEHIAPHFDLLI